VRFVFMVLMLFMPASLWAACAGQDVREQRNESQKTEIMQRLVGIPFSEGNCWTATRGDRKVHIVGTIHMDHPVLDTIALRLAR